MVGTAQAANEISLPESPGQKLEYVKKNMFKVQAAAERYAGHHQGRYPVKIDAAFQSYFPFGAADDKNFSTLSCLYNPYTSVREMPVPGKIKSIKEAYSQRQSRIGKGVTEYNPIENGKGYVIRGAADNGEIIRDLKKPYILTNDPKLAVLANMMAVQFAAESYYEQFGKFPTVLDAGFKNCFPNHQTGLSKRTITGLPLRNPYTQRLEWPRLGTFKTVKDARFTPPGDLQPGVIEYNPIDGGKDYAIRAGGPNGKAFIRHKNDQQTFTLSKAGEL